MRAAERYIQPSTLIPGPSPRKGEGGQITAQFVSPLPSELASGAGRRAGDEGGRVRLNDTQYFDNVPPEAWEFRVGGYQPAFMWLDDRMGRRLTEEDILHYRRVLAALRETVVLLPVADAAFSTILNT